MKGNYTNPTSHLILAVPSPIGEVSPAGQSYMVSLDIPNRSYTFREFPIGCGGFCKIGPKFYYAGGYILASTGIAESSSFTELTVYPDLRVEKRTLPPLIRPVGSHSLVPVMDRAIYTNYGAKFDIATEKWVRIPVSNMHTATRSWKMNDRFIYAYGANIHGNLVMQRLDVLDEENSWEPVGTSSPIDNFRGDPVQVSPTEAIFMEWPEAEGLIKFNLMTDRYQKVAGKYDPGTWYIFPSNAEMILCCRGSENVFGVRLRDFQVVRFSLKEKAMEKEEVQSVQKKDKFGGRKAKGAGRKTEVKDEPKVREKEKKPNKKKR